MIFRGKTCKLTDHKKSQSALTTSQDREHGGDLIDVWRNLNGLWPPLYVEIHAETWSWLWRAVIRALYVLGGA
jgi:hypothetical protein